MYILKWIIVQIKYIIEKLSNLLNTLSIQFRMSVNWYDYLIITDFWHILDFIIHIIALLTAGL